MKNRTRSIFSLFCLLMVALSVASGCSHNTDSATTATSTTTAPGKVSATPPPGFDVQKAQASQQAAQKASEDFRKYLEKKK